MVCSPDFGHLNPEIDGMVCNCRDQIKFVIPGGEDDDQKKVQTQKEQRLFLHDDKS